MAEVMAPFDEAADFASDVAKAAGKEALNWFRRPIGIDFKSDQSPVTQADRLVEELIRKAIGTKYPGHSILGEEFGASDDLEGLTWVIDPIDGTRSFISGSPLWGTLIALSENLGSRIGVVEMPALGERWLGVGGSRTFHENGSGIRTPCNVRSCKRLEEATFYTTSPLYFVSDENECINQIIDRASLTRFGGDCYNYGLLASGHIDLVIESRLEPYDFMALVPVIESAGGVISDWAGNPLDLNSGKQVIAACTPELHVQALKLLNP